MSARRTLIHILWAAPALCLLLPMPRAWSFQQSDSGFEDSAATAQRTLLVDDEDEPVDGFFPTPKMIDRVIDRVAEGMAEHLDLDESQRSAVAQALRTRVPGWLNQNRNEIKRLTNAYFEALLDDHPPPADDVADWARRASPLMDQFRGVVEEVVGDFSAALNESQAATVQSELAAFRVGISVVQSKLQLWAEGGYDPEVDWPRGAKYAEMEAAEQAALEKAQEEARKAVLSADRAHAAAELNDPGVERVRAEMQSGAQIAVVGEISPPKEDRGMVPVDVVVTTTRPAIAASKPAVLEVQDEWGRYVDAFVARYALDEGQQNSARLFLREARRRRDRYQESKLEDFRKLEAALRKPGDKNIEQLQREYRALQAPIDRCFDQLKERLEKLPTRKQRRDALEREEAAPKKDDQPVKG